MPQTTPHVTIIGAGIGGLVSALLLAHKGVRVTVVEQAKKPGGKLRQLFVDGRGIDSGPTVMTMRWVFDELFDALGSSADAHIDFRSAERIARHAWSADGFLDLFVDLERSAEAIGDFAGADEARRFLAFSDEARRIYDTVEEPFIRGPQRGVFGLMRETGANGMADLWNIRPYASVWRALGGHFRDPRLQQLFGRYAGYCGASPFRAPATLMLVAHVEQQGIWYVQGGMVRIAETVAGLCEQNGVEFRLGHRVERIRFANGRAAGLVLDDGETIEADAVIHNGDVAALADGLLGDGGRRAVRPVKLPQRSMSAVTWSMLARCDGFPLVRHNVFFSDDYAAEFRAIFRTRRAPACPTVYVCAQDREDEDAAIAGAERLFLIMNAPPTGDRHRLNEAEVEECATRTFGRLQDCGLKIERTENNHHVTTPTEFNRMFPATGGALYGRASHGWRSAFHRPGSRSKVPGLYVAGGSAHPGPGVPMAALSGRQAAESLLEDLASTRR
jgi:1-hydroxycarotenoid 3,4-desaturase